jgi:hypothetical protein
MSTKDSIPQTPEAIAYELLKDIFLSENIYLAYKGFTPNTGHRKPTREEILQTYKQCIATVKSS